MLADFIANVRRRGLELIFGRFYGLYRAEVVDVADPQKRGRIRATVHGAMQSQPTDAWILPAFDGAGASRGTFWPPEVGDSVLVGFQNGDPDHPDYYLGGWFGTSDTPAEFGYEAKKPTRRGMVTRGGHALLFDDTSGAETVAIRWHAAAAGDASRSDLTKSADRGTGKTASLAFSPEGVTLQTDDGSKVQLLANDGSLTIAHKGGAKVEITASGVTLTASSVDVKAGSVNLGNGASHALVRGDVLQSWLATHFHPLAGPPGNTGAPVIPPTGILSPTVKVP